MKKIALSAVLLASFSAFTAQGSFFGLMAHFVKYLKPSTEQGVVGHAEMNKAILSANVEAVKKQLTTQTFTKVEYNAFIAMAERALSLATERLDCIIGYSLIGTLVGGSLGIVETSRLYRRRNTSAAAQDALNERLLQKRIDALTAQQERLKTSDSWFSWSARKSVKKEYKMRLKTLNKIMNKPDRKEKWLKQQRWNTSTYVGSAIAAAVGFYALGTSVHALGTFGKDMVHLEDIIKALKEAHDTQIKAAIAELRSKK